MTDKNGNFTRRELAREISKNTFVKAEIVEDVLASFVNIAIEEIVNKGTFSLENFITVSSKNFSGYKLGDRIIPDHQRLTVRISKKLRDLRKFKLLELENEDGIIGRDNWREAFNYFKEKRSIANRDFENPMLKDD